MKKICDTCTKWLPRDSKGDFGWRQCGKPRKEEPNLLNKWNEECIRPNEYEKD